MGNLLLFIIFIVNFEKNLENIFCEVANGGIYREKALPLFGASPAQK
jgi:hypothetical protein